MKFCTFHRPLSRLALVGLLLRVLVPAGFMPASVSDGWYLQWCPGSTPASVLAALLDHGDHQHHGDDTASYVQCDLGSAFSSPTMAAGFAEAAPLPVQPTFLPWEVRTQVDATTLSAYESRAPPRPLFRS